MTTVVPIHTARSRLTDIVEEAHYKSRPFLITRHKKPMAAVIGTEEFTNIFKLLEKHDPGLADTLAISSNPEMIKKLEKSRKEIAKGKTVPIQKLRKD